MKELMKIAHAEFGFGGYDDAMFGLSLTFTGDGSGTMDFWGAFPKFLPQFGETAEKIAAVLKAAKVMHVSQLVGKPVEVIFNGGRMESWRVLTEVL